MNASIRRLALSPCLLLLLGPCPARGQTIPSHRKQAVARVLAAAELRLRQVPDPEDVPGLAARLGFAPEAMARFLREEVAFAPYAGTLRGAGGTLAARAGSSLDRALLLHRLLAAAGRPSRLVRVRLEEKEAAALVDRWLAAAPRGGTAVAEPPAARLRRAAALAGVKEELFLARQKQRRAEADDLLAAALAGARQAAQRLEKTLAQAGELPPGASPDWRRELVEAVRDHYGVQVRPPGEKKWRHLFPPLPEALAGRARVVREGTLPAAKVGFRVVLRRRRDRKEERIKLLERRCPLTEATMKGIYLALLPGRDQLPPPAKLWAMPLAERLQALARARILRLELHLDGRVYGGLPFDREGQVYETHGDGRVKAAKGLGKALGGLLGGMTGGGEEKKKPATAFLGLDLELQVLLPGRKPRLHTRTLLAPPAAAGPRPLPLLRLAILLQTRPLAPGEKERRFLASLVRHDEFIKRILAGKLDGLRLAGPRRIAEGLMLLAEYRRKARAAFLAEAAGRVRLLRRGPDILMESWKLVGEDKGPARFVHAFDLVACGLVPLPAGADPDPARARRTALLLGAGDTALEALVLATIGPARRSRSAWNLLERARLLDPTPRVAEAGPGRLRLSWGGGGDPPRAWWEIDRVTGLALGRVPGGAGQAMLEAAIEVRSKVNTICDVSNLAKMFIAAKPPKGALAKAGMKAWDAACGIVAGNLPTTVLQWQLNDMTNGLWQGATDALAGL